MSQVKSREEIAATLDDILAGPEFQDERTLWDEFWDWISANFEVGEALGLGEFLKGILIAVLVVVLIAYVVMWIRVLRARERRLAEGARPAVSALERARSLAEQAREARERGDERKAIRLYLHALIVGFSRQGGLAYRAAWTNRELLQRGAPTAHVKETLEALVRRYEPKEFGRDDIVPGDLDALEGLARRELWGREVSA